VLLPAVNEDEAFSVAERIRKSVEAAAIRNPGSRVSRQVTISIGVAVQTADEAISSEQLQRLADEALYRAKQAGRNRILLYGQEPDEHRSAG
jgi:diguanylate cyclase (GGDEF)-like protein